MKTQRINIKEKLSLFDQYWTPRVIGELNDYQIKLVKIVGEFVWHAHDDTDEMFLCIAGNMRIEMRDGVVELGEGDLYVVPRGVEHKPSAVEECHVLLVEPRGVVNTGRSGGKLTAPNDAWV